MYSIDLFSKSVLASCLLTISTFALAHENHRADMVESIAPTVQSSAEISEISEVDHSSMQHSMMSQASHTAMDHSQHHRVDAKSVQVNVSAMAETAQMQHLQSHSSPSQTQLIIRASHSGHDHRKEHGAQVYAITTFEHTWRINPAGVGALKSELESRIGTDENKVFIKIHTNKTESQHTELDAKVLYSRMLSDFWDAQVGVRYRAEKVKLDQHRHDTEEQRDGVIGLHGMAPYFFETDAYFYIGEDRYSGLSVETERDLLLTQKLIFKPYLDLTIVLSDDSKYAQKSGLSQVTTGFETRYEISKKIMPYLDIAYEYSKGSDATDGQEPRDSEKGWLYGAGLRFKF